MLSGGSSGRIDKLEETVDRLDAELEIIKEQNRLVIQRTTLGFRDQFYLKLGVEVSLPRPRTFEFDTDTGTGVSVGLGRYLGRHNVVELSLDYDIFPSATLRYRFEFQSAMPSLTWGPVVGMKARLAKVSPFDSSISRPEDLKSIYWLVGGMAGFPIARSLLSIEAVYLTNQQSFFFLTAGLNFFW